STATAPSPSPDHPPAAAVSEAPVSLALPQKIVVSVVNKDEIEAAIQDFPAAVQPKIRKDVAAGKYRLLWLTVWDWDTSQETGDTISILSNDYRRFVILNSR